MKCDEIKELMLDAAIGGQGVPGMIEHLLDCPACAGKLQEMRKTMALLDEWQAPEPSPYFDTRLAARMREERAKPERKSWFSWVRMPVLAGALALVLMMAGGVNGLTRSRTPSGPAGKAGPPPVPAAGTALGALVTLAQ